MYFAELLTVFAVISKSFLDDASEELNKPNEVRGVEPLGIRDAKNAKDEMLNENLKPKNENLMKLNSHSNVAHSEASSA